MPSQQRVLTPDPKAWELYCIARMDPRPPGRGHGALTYVGVTVDFKHRLRQHNGELKGGARATRGGTWRRLYVVRGFPDQRTALQWEWRLHRRSPPTRNRCARCRRLRDLKTARGMESVTSTARPTSSLRLRISYYSSARACRTGTCQAAPIKKTRRRRARPRKSGARTRVK